MRRCPPLPGPPLVPYTTLFRSEAFGKLGDKWIGIPIATTGALVAYRKSAVEKAGFKEFPKDLAGFSELVKGMNKNGTPAGMALRSEEHTSELQSRENLVCRLLL